MQFYKTQKSITQLSYEIIDYIIVFQKKLGSGFLESVYEKYLKYLLEFKDVTLNQSQISIWFTKNTALIKKLQ